MGRNGDQWLRTSTRPPSARSRSMIRSAFAPSHPRVAAAFDSAAWDAQCIQVSSISSNLTGWYRGRILMPWHQGILGSTNIDSCTKCIPFVERPRTARTRMPHVWCGHDHGIRLSAHSCYTRRCDNQSVRFESYYSWSNVINLDETAVLYSRS